MNHFEVMKRSEKLDLAAPSKTLAKKITGKFYTHEIIGRSLARSICDELEHLKSISIIDPFCGDGRLVCWFLEMCVAQTFAPKLKVELWDYEAAAVQIARRNILNTASSLGLHVEVVAKVCNSFREAKKCFGFYNACITNPPWELLKPDRRDLKMLSPVERSTYIEQMRREDRFLASCYPQSQPVRKFSGWGTSLARVGTELALRLVAENGVCGIVSPASFLADQMSAPLREWMLTRFKVKKLSYYPAEARLFEGVDQASVSFVAKNSKPTRFSACAEVYDSSARLKDSAHVAIRKSQLVSWNYSLPLNCGPTGVKLLEKIDFLPRLSDFESHEEFGLWTGREIDETDAKSYLAERGKYRFVKGRMIARFGIVEKPTNFIRAEGRVVPPSADRIRIVWRDVSRPNQRRRMIATIIPAGWVAGNSLHVAYFRDDNLQRLKALLVVLNSFCFEFQIRGLLATSHVSVGVARRTRVPDLNNEKLVSALAVLGDACLAADDGSQYLSESVIAQCYGYSVSDFKSMLSFFPKIDDREVAAITEAKNWRRAGEIVRKMKSIT